LSSYHLTEKTGFLKWPLRIIFWAVLVWLSLLQPARPADLPVEQAGSEGKPIRSIAVISPRGFSSQDVQQITGIKIGEPYSTTRIRQGLERLYRTGDFRDILIETEPKADGIQVTFTLVDKPPISEIRLKGNGTFPSNDLQRVMQVKTGDEFSNAGWKAALARLVTYYRQQGFLRARIVSETSTIEKENRVILVAEIQEGQRARVRDIQFHGDSVFPPAKLKTIIKTTPGGPYQTDQMEDDLKALEQFYTKEGYLKATIGPPNITYHENTNEVVIRFPIDAGIQLKVTFTGNANFPAEVLKGQLLVWEERSFDAGVLEESARRIEGFYQSKGYLFAKVEQQFDDQAENHPTSGIVEVKFKISEGNRVSINKITIQDNHIVSSQEIKKLMSTKESGLFTSTVLNRAALDNDKKSILKLYHSKGYLEASVQEAINFNKDRSEMYITLQIKEGAQVIVRKILFSGNSALSDQDLRKAIVLAEGMPYNEGQTYLDRFNLLALYAQNGFLSAQIDLKSTLSEDKRGIRLVYQIEER
jgi:outer membrane protein insertion porin family